jgi:hypothetical protein
VLDTRLKRAESRQRRWPQHEGGSSPITHRSCLSYLFLPSKLENAFSMPSTHRLPSSTFQPCYTDNGTPIFHLSLQIHRLLLHRIYIHHSPFTHTSFVLSSASIIMSTASTKQAGNSSAANPPVANPPAPVLTKNQIKRWRRNIKSEHPYPSNAQQQQLVHGRINLDNARHIPIRVNNPSSNSPR